MAKTTTEPAVEKKPRKSTKKQFVLQRLDGDDVTGGWDDVAPVANAAAGRKHVSTNGLAGTFRVIAVGESFVAKATTVTKILFE